MTFKTGSKAIELDSNNIAAYCWRGVSYQQNGDYDAAIADLNKATELAKAAAC